MINRIMQLVLCLMTILIIQAAFAIQEKFPDDKIKGIPVIELEPTEDYSLNEYKQKDLEIQKKYSGVWTTLNHLNLNRYTITSDSSSNLGKQYLSANLYDGKQETAWVEGAKGKGIGEWVKIKIDAYRYVSEYTSTPFSIEEVGVIPGYAKSEKTWNENNRVKTLLFIVKSPPSPFPEDPEWAVFRLNLEDKNQLQFFEIPRDTIVYNDDPMTKTVWIKIEDIYKGTKYDDTCISELVLYGGCSN